MNLVRALLFFTHLALTPFAFSKKESTDEQHTLPDYSNYTVSKEDEIPWKFERKGRLIVIGDIHGDVDALLSILTHASLIEERGNEIIWIGGKDVQIVFMGDIVAKGSNSAHVLNLLIHLETLMKKESSELHLILGNHEARALQRNFSKFSLRDLERLEKMGPPHELFSENGLYGKWLAQKNSILQIGDYIFCHRGLSDWIHKFNPGAINSTSREWIRFWMTGNNSPPSSSSWVVGKKSLQDGIPAHEGPMDSPSLSPFENSTKQNGMMSLPSLRKALSNLNAKKLFIGHYPILNQVGPHPLYGSLTWLTDSGISKSMKNGKILYLDLALEEEPTHFIEVPREGHHPMRTSGCLKSLRAQLKSH